MKKKGFTLVELLAVIAILAILVIIALPNVLGMFQSAKKNTFTTELQNIYKSATTQYVSDSMNRKAGAQATGITYARQGGKSCGTSNLLDLSGTETIDYYIEFNLSGEVIKYFATDGEFGFYFDDASGLAIEDINVKYKVITMAKQEVSGVNYTANITGLTEGAENGNCTVSGTGHISIGRATSTKAN